MTATMSRTLRRMRGAGLFVVLMTAVACQFSENRYLARTVRAEALVGSWRATEFAIKSLRDVGIRNHLAAHEHTLVHAVLLLRRGRRPLASVAVPRRLSGAALPSGHLSENGQGPPVSRLPGARLTTWASLCSYACCCRFCNSRHPSRLRPREIRSASDRLKSFARRTSA